MELAIANASKVLADVNQLKENTTDTSLKQCFVECSGLYRRMIILLRSSISCLRRNDSWLRPFMFSLDAGDRAEKCEDELNWCLIFFLCLQMVMAANCPPSLPISGSSGLSSLLDFMAVMLELIRIVIFELNVLYPLLGCSFLYVFVLHIWLEWVFLIENIYIDLGHGPIWLMNNEPF